MERNANDKVNRWGLELPTYNITFEWISGAPDKVAHCPSCLVELPQNHPTAINVLSITHPHGPAFNTRSRTAQQNSSNDSTPHTNVTVPVVMLFNCQIRGLMPVINRPPIGVDNDDEHHKVIIKRQPKNHKDKVTSKKLCLSP